MAQLGRHVPPQGQGQGRLGQQQGGHRAKAQGRGIRPKGGHGHQGLRCREAHQQDGRQQAAQGGAPVQAAQPLLLEFRLGHVRLRGDGFFLLRFRLGLGLGGCQRPEKSAHRRQSRPAQGGPAGTAGLTLLLLPLQLPLGRLLLHHGGDRPVHHVLQGYQVLPGRGFLLRLRGLLLRGRDVLFRWFLRDFRPSGFLLPGFFRVGFLRRRLCLRDFRLRHLRRGDRLRGGLRWRLRLPGLYRAGAELRQDVVQVVLLGQGHVLQEPAGVLQGLIQFFLSVFAHSPRLHPAAYRLI